MRDWESLKEEEKSERGRRGPAYREGSVRKKGML